MLDTLEDLKSYCEDPIYLQKKKQVILRDDVDEINDRDEND